MDDLFECRSIYLGIYSAQAATMSIACSFPNQGAAIAQRDENISNITNKEMSSKFKSEIDDQIEKMGNDLGA